MKSRESLTQSDIQLLLNWTNAELAASNAKKAESHLRKLVIKNIFNGDIKGTRTLNLDEKHKIKISATESYKLDSAETEQVMIEICEKYGDELGVSICESLFSVEYKLDKQAYDSASDDIKKLVNKALTIKLNSSTLKYITPTSTKDEEIEE